MNMAPQNFAWINHDVPATLFLDAMASGRMPHAWMLTGPQGLGKAHFAHQVALTLLEWKPGAPAPLRLDLANGGPAARLIDADAHPEFHLLERPPAKLQLPRIKDLTRREWPKDLERAGAIGVDQVRSIIAKMHLKSAISRFRVIIIDSIDDMGREPANALLKVLEEPPANTIFLCISHAPDRLLPTIRSRCRVARFAPLSAQQMQDFLLSAMPETSAADRDALCLLAEGSPGRALAQSAHGYAELAELLRKIIENGDLDNVLRGQLAKSISGKGGRDAYFAVLEAAPAIAADVARMSPPAISQNAIIAHGKLVRLCADRKSVV
jgi:DNA polymerase-3 subunit delta'